MSDRIFGGIGLALAVFYIWAASIIPDSFMSDVIGPRTFPYIIGAILVITSLVFIAKPDAAPDWPALRQLGEIIFAAAVLLAYCIALPEVGFVAATVLATAYLTWRLGSHPGWSLVTGLATAVGIYVVFHLVLGLSLARGPWGF